MRYIEVTIQTDQSSTRKKFLSFLQTESFFTAGGHAHFGQAGRQSLPLACRLADIRHSQLPTREGWGHKLPPQSRMAPTLGETSHCPASKEKNHCAAFPSTASGATPPPQSPGREGAHSRGSRRAPARPAFVPRANG